MKRLALLLLCLISSTAQAMQLSRCAHFNGMANLRSSPTAVTVTNRSPLLSKQLAAVRSTNLASRQLASNVPVAFNERSVGQLQEIDKQLQVTRKNKIMASIRSKAWDTSGVMLIAPTVAAYYLSGAGLFAAFISIPGCDSLDWSDTITVMGVGAVHLASRAALRAEERLCDSIEKKCYDNDKKILEAKNLIEELRKQRKELSEKEQQ